MLWPANGALLVALRDTPRRRIPWLVLGVLVVQPLANLLSGRPPIAAIGFSVANVIETGLGVVIAGRLRQRAGSVTHRLLAYLLGLIVGALVGAGVATALSLALGGDVSTYPVWFASVTVGAIVTAPVVAMLTGRLKVEVLSRARLVEGGLALATVSAVTAGLFSASSPVATALLLTPYPVLLWIALRQPQPIALLGVGITSSIACAATLNGLGPLIALSPDPRVQVLWLQGYLLLSALMTLVVANESDSRRRAQRKLEEQQRLYALVSENAEDIITLTDAKGTWLFVSPAVQRLTGYAPPELLGRTVLEFVHPIDRQRVVDTYQGLFARGGTVQVRYRARRRDGSWMWLDASSRVVERPEGGRQAVTVARDAQVQVELEQRLLRSQRLEAVGRMAAGLTHDFNNLLAVAQAAVSYLQRPQEAGDAREVLDELASSMRRGQEIARQLLSFSRGAAVDRETGDLVSSVSEGVTLARRALRDRLKVEVESHEPLRARFNPGQLQQVVVNLLLNAADAAPVGSTARISFGFTSPGFSGDASLQQIEPAVEPSPGRHTHVAFVVDDAGPGVPEALRASIFEPFVSTKGEGEGTGLGLAMVRSIADAHDGLVWCCRSPLGGARFVFALPIAAVSVTASDAPRRAAG